MDDKGVKCSVLFVCMGNTCRSTMAEGILRHLLKERGLTEKYHVDSAAIMNWQVGNPIDKRTLAVLKENNIDPFHHVARHITRNDFFNFDYILGMDDYNISDLSSMKPTDSKAYIGLLGSFDLSAEDPVIHEPYCQDDIPNCVHKMLCWLFRIPEQKHYENYFMTRERELLYDEGN